MSCPKVDMSSRRPPSLVEPREGGVLLDGVPNRVRTLRIYARVRANLPSYRLAWGISAHSAEVNLPASNLAGMMPSAG